MTARRPPKRQRRTAEEARREIIDATEIKLRELGPAGIRLQQIAEDVGVSHPAILHHFGSREGLIRAVVNRAVERLETDIIAAIATSPSPGKPLIADLVNRAFRVMVDGGHARVAAWLLLSGDLPLGATRVRAIAEVAHQRRLTLEGDGPPPAFEDTVFRMVLVALTLFGEAIAGDAMRESAGLTDEAAPERFREWLAQLLAGSAHG